jgi:hypothetical protein
MIRDFLEECGPELLFTYFVTLTACWAVVKWGL